MSYARLIDERELSIGPLYNQLKVTERLRLH
jgi:hypothetical protein